MSSVQEYLLRDLSFGLDSRQTTALIRTQLDNWKQVTSLVINFVSQIARVFVSVYGRDDVATRSQAEEKF